jgi:aminoglycoside phosphotransferase (APT) family kinase protein
MSVAAAGVPGIDSARLAAWLAGPLPELEPPLGFVRIGEGQSNLTFRVEDVAGHVVVVRRPPLGERLASAHDMSREYRILSCLAPAGAPVPRPFGFCDDPSVADAPFYAMEHVDGIVLNRVDAAERLTTAERRLAARSMASTLAGLHGFDIAAVGLGDFRRPESLAGRQLRRWTKQWHASKTRELPLIDELAHQFAERMPEEREQVLVHGDYHLNNAIFGLDGTVRAILDWELCTVGDPLADVGLMVAYWNELGRHATRDDALFREPVTVLPGFPDASELALDYASASGRDLGELGFWVAFAYWKVAVIVEGVYRRWLNDPTNGSDAGGLRPAVDRLAALALAAMESDGQALSGSDRDEESRSADVSHTIAGEQRRS